MYDLAYQHRRARKPHKPVYMCDVLAFTTMHTSQRYAHQTAADASPTAVLDLLTVIDKKKYT